MSLIPKVVAGLCAGAVAGSLGVAFWPSIEPSAISPRTAVTQPEFVASTAPAKPAAPTAPTQDKNAALVKLAAALTTPPATADKPTPTADKPPATRAITPAVSVAATPVDDAAKRFCAQGMIAFANGDIAAARTLLERAAEAGDARALMVLGATYDPAALARAGVLGMKGDAAQARSFYAKALAAGFDAARERIAALDAP